MVDRERPWLFCVVLTTSWLYSQFQQLKAAVLSDTIQYLACITWLWRNGSPTYNPIGRTRQGCLCEPEWPRVTFPITSVLPTPTPGRKRIERNNNAQKRIQRMVSINRCTHKRQKRVTCPEKLNTRRTLHRLKWLQETWIITNNYFSIQDHNLK